MVLIFVFFTFFRGMSNIVNALLVPLTMTVMMAGETRRARMVFSFAVVLLVLLFFQAQIIFILLYILISEALLQISKSPRPFWLQGLSIGVLAGLGFWAAILLTDAVFKTRIHTFMLMLAQGNVLRLALIMLGEGLIIGFLLVWSWRFLQKRLRPDSNPSGVREI